MDSKETNNVEENHQEPSTKDLSKKQKHKVKSSFKKFMIIILTSLLLITLGLVLYPFIRLLPKGYHLNSIISIGINNLTEIISSNPYSELLDYSLTINQSNVKKYEYYYLQPTEYPAGYTTESLYQLINRFESKGYLAQDVKLFIDIYDTKSYDLILSHDYPNNHDNLITAINQHYGLESCFKIANYDDELAKEILNGKVLFTTIDDLQTKGYTTENIKTLALYLSADNFNLVSKMKYFEVLPQLVQEKDFEFSHLARYLWAIDSGKDIQEAISYIEANGDVVQVGLINWSNLYSNIKNVTNPNSYTVLVNKQNYLGEYIPEDLVYFPSGYYVNNHPMRKEAKEALIRLSDAAVAAGYGRIKAQSNYRSYSLQAGLYSDYKATYGQSYADQISARPGYSEHQTGLVSDLSGSGKDMLYFDDYNGYQWVLKNAHNYGFIQRYPEGKEYITGYEFESWHFRYVGVEAATIIYNNDWTLEEYSYLLNE